MVIIPRDKPVIENLNIYYLDVEKLLEHYQGEIGTGGVYFKSHAAEGVIFFDKDDLLNGVYREKGLELTDADAIDRLVNSGGKHNFNVHVYHLPQREVYFWASIPTAERIHQDLSTEFTDLEGLIRKMSSEKLTGYIDVRIGNGQENGLIFIIGGNIMGGAFSWDNGEPGPTKKNQQLLIHKTKERGGSFNVCRIPLSRLKLQRKAASALPKPSPHVLSMLEDFLNLLEKTVGSKKKIKNDFNKMLKKKFVENAERYTFLDPFAGEFEYADQQISFTGSAGDKELIDGVLNSARQLARELGLLPELIENSSAWHRKYSKELDNFNVRLET